MFRPRCQYHQFVTDGRCDTVRPMLDEVAEGHSARCHLSGADKQRLAAERLAIAQHAEGGRVSDPILKITDLQK